MAEMFRSKPQVIEAVQWLGDNLEEVAEFANVDVTKLHVASVSDSVRGSDGPNYVDELQLLAGKNGAQGWVDLPPFHWLVSMPGDRSDIWPVDPEYFAGKYEPTEETADGR